MKYLEIGDLHVKKDNINESEKFIRWIIEIGKKIKTSDNVSLVFLGDQFNDFGIARVEVVKFWTWASYFLKSVFGKENVFYLVGNHDRNSEGTDTAMYAFHENGIIADKEAIEIGNKIGAIGFVRDNEVFVSEVMKLHSRGVKTVYCHQEFQGAMFESGAYAPHGVDPFRFPEDIKFRSGHFHKKQNFGNIKYLGTPRHLTKSDIGEVKGVHVFDSKTLTEEFIETPEDVCKPFKIITISEGDKIPNIEHTDKTYVQLHGSKEWCAKTEKKIPTGTKIYCTYTDTVKEAKIKESDGIPVSFLKFFETQDIPAELKSAVLKNIYEACPQLRGTSE